MKTTFKNLSLVFAAGGIGGLANAVIIWLFGYLGIPAALGVSIAPPLAPPFIYAKVVWGGIWGLALLIPIFNNKLLVKAFIVSLFPTLVQLFIVFPVRDGKDLLGLALGTLTPLFVILYNYVWGLVAVYWHKTTTE